MLSPSVLHGLGEAVGCPRAACVLTPTLMTMMMVITHQSSTGILQGIWMGWSHLFQFWSVTSPLLWRSFLLSQAVTKQCLGLYRRITS